MAEENKGEQQQQPDAQADLEAKSPQAASNGKPLKDSLSEGDSFNR